MNNLYKDCNIIKFKNNDRNIFGDLMKRIESEGA